MALDQVSSDGRGHRVPALPEAHDEHAPSSSEMYGLLNYACIVEASVKKLVLLYRAHELSIRLPP